MNLNKKELKIISYDFRCIANRLINARYDNVDSILKKFVAYIKNTPLIYEYINSCTIKDFDIENYLNNLNSYSRRKLEWGYTSEDEVYTIYSIFEYFTNDSNKSITALAMNISSLRNFNETVKSFNEKVSLVLINHIENYLTRISIKMGYDEEVTYMITINGEQVNISKDNSTLNAIQNKGSVPDELTKIVQEISKSLDNNISDEQKEIIQESVDTIQRELKNDKPKKGLIKACITGLNTVTTNIPTAIKLCDNIKQLVDYATNLIN